MHPSRSTTPKAAAAALLCVLAGLTGCDESPKKVSEFTGGNATNGKVAINHYGCASCHTIPGIRGATALVGPPLTQVGGRMYIGGVMKNTPVNMIRWIQDPPAVDSMTAMPKLNVSEADARDIASYLFTLK